MVLAYEAVSNGLIPDIWIGTLLAEIVSRELS